MSDLPTLYTAPTVEDVRHALHAMPGDADAFAVAGDRDDLAPCVFLRIDRQVWRFAPVDAIELSARLGAGERGPRLNLARQVALAGCIAFTRQVAESRKSGVLDALAHEQAAA
ncbi:hypothetical protein [Brevundimonas sp.]|uniref:hypothetical protein n=1 Tax=Brevundimonas sp. TaxID=1871086 RepID=UPI002D6EF24A|nr:hypothetical protein [Brevundimonas sp.]HYD26928.1 hypothetical protein [Brevundimonas sp.]